jgi:protein-tyrosine-phosphatase
MSVVLFVCTGNLCRSPMAEGLLQHKLAQKDLAGRHEVHSVGVWAIDGRPASPNAVAIMAERGIDIKDHTARTITSSDVAEADLILVMSREHAELIRNTWPQYGWQVYLLSEMTGKRKDVEDPYGGSIEEYRACADVIARYIDQGFPRILELL